MDYWKECISEAFEEAKIGATDEQIETVASWAESAHDNYGTAMGYDCIPNPLVQENEKLKTDLRKERDKVYCKECHGTGRIRSSGPVRSSDTECDVCHGEGRHS